MQATAIDNLNVHGSAKNFTVSRAATPFSSESSGLNYLKKATFGGNADGVGIDVKGKIGKLTFKTRAGQSRPGSSPASRQADWRCRRRPTARRRRPTGYPAAGDLGGTVRASKIGKLTVKPANVHGPDAGESAVRPAPAAGLADLRQQHWLLRSPTRSSRHRARSARPISPARRSTPRSRPGSTTRPTCRAGRDAGGEQDHGAQDRRRSDQQRRRRRRSGRPTTITPRATGTAGPGQINVHRRTASRTIPAARPGWATPARACSPAHRALKVKSAREISRQERRVTACRVAGGRSRRAPRAFMRLGRASLPSRRPFTLARAQRSPS